MENSEWPTVYDARELALNFRSFKEFSAYHLKLFKTFDGLKTNLERRMIILVVAECCLKFNHIIFEKYQVMVDILIRKLVDGEFPDKKYIKLLKRLSKKHILQAKLNYIEWVLGKTILTYDCVKYITTFIE